MGQKIQFIEPILISDVYNNSLQACSVLDAYLLSLSLKNVGVAVCTTTALKLSITNFPTSV